MGHEHRRAGVGVLSRLRLAGTGTLIAATVVLASAGGAVATDAAADTAVSTDALELHQRGHTLEVETSALVPYPPDEVWPVLLDFDALPRYMPNVDSSHVIARTRWQTVVRQVGTTRFVARRTVRFELAFHRMNENEVAFEQTRGDFDRFRGVWSVRPEEAGSRVGYHAWITDDFGIPGFLVRHVVRRDAAKMMPAIAREVRRRHGEAG